MMTKDTGPLAPVAELELELAVSVQQDSDELIRRRDELIRRRDELRRRRDELDEEWERAEQERRTLEIMRRVHEHWRFPFN